MTKRRAYTTKKGDGFLYGGEDILKAGFSESPRLSVLVSSVKKQQQILNNPYMSSVEKVALIDSIKPDIRKLF